LFGGLLAAPLLMAQPDVASHMFPTSRPGSLGLTYLVGMAIAAFLAFNWLNRNMSSTPMSPR